jgi:hypothetical protein
VQIQVWRDIVSVVIYLFMVDFSGWILNIAYYAPEFWFHDGTYFGFVVTVILFERIPYTTPKQILIPCITLESFVSLI